MRSRSRIRTDGRTVVLGRVESSKKRLASSHPTTRRTCHRSVAIAIHIVPYDCDLDRVFTNVLRHAQTAGATPPGIHPTSTSRDVSDQAFPSLSNFYCMLRCTCGEGLVHNIVIYNGKQVLQCPITQTIFIMCLVT